MTSTGSEAQLRYDLILKIEDHVRRLVARPPDDLLVVRLPPQGIAIEAVERAAVVAALEACGWMQTEAAKFLRISPRVVNYMIRKHEIALPADNRHVRRYAWRRRATSQPPRRTA